MYIDSILTQEYVIKALFCYSLPKMSSRALGRDLFEIILQDIFNNARKIKIVHLVIIINNNNIF